MSMEAPAAVHWEGGLEGHLELIDQTRLPGELAILKLRELQQVVEAIQRLAVRGAPAIGIAAAFGLVLGVRHASDDLPAFQAALNRGAESLVSARPTAVNLAWAVRRLQEAAAAAPPDAAVRKACLLKEAQRIAAEDRTMCEAMGRVGAELVQDGDGLLTHCNAGGLAASYHGTAVGVLVEAHRQGKQVHIYADETRPLLQGARLTTWELMRAGVATTLICDNTAAEVMKEGRIQRVFVGADRIARNGDAANKIGTYGVAILARHHKIPFYVVAPSSTFDLACPTGARIQIEERDPAEVTEGFGARIAPEGVAVYAPAFDVTPASLITAIVTEKGLISPVNESSIQALLKRG